MGLRILPTSSAVRRRLPSVQRWVLISAACHAARHFPLAGRHSSALRLQILAVTIRRASAMGVGYFKRGPDRR